MFLPPHTPTPTPTLDPSAGYSLWDDSLASVLVTDYDPNPLGLELGVKCAGDSDFVRFEDRLILPAKVPGISTLLNTFDRISSARRSGRG